MSKDLDEFFVLYAVCAQGVESLAHLAKSLAWSESGMLRVLFETGYVEERFLVTTGVGPIPDEAHCDTKWSKAGMCCK